MLVAPLWETPSLLASPKGRGFRQRRASRREGGFPHEQVAWIKKHLERFDTYNKTFKTSS